MDRALHESQMFLIVQKTEHQPIGFCQAYDVNLAEGWCSLLLYVVTEFRRHPHPAEAGLIFLDFLFKHFPLRKVYADVFEYNRESLTLLKKGGFREEARLPNHVWYEDRYWSLIKLALYREVYVTDVKPRLQFILTLQDEFNSLVDSTARLSQRPP